MWSLYLLPGRIIAELGFLWPGKNQYGATRRRRESTFAHFILATPFWVVFGMFVVPVLVALVASAIHMPRSNLHPSTSSAAVSQSQPSTDSVANDEKRPAPDEVEAPTRGSGPDRASEKRSAAPRFAAPKEVVQDMAASKEPYQTCSATITDHCVDR